MSAPALPAVLDLPVESLVSTHLGLADAIARRYSGRGIERDDLTQVARLALVKAAQRFDPTRGDSFEAYAAPSISGEIKRHFRDAGWMIRPPRRLQELSAERRHADADLTHRLGRRPTDAELGAVLGLGLHELRTVIATAGLFSCLSLDAPAPHEDGSAGGPSETSDPGAEQFTAVEERDWLHRAMSDLGERERLVLRLRFVHSWTQTQIADHIGVSQMQVSRILRATLDSLRVTLTASPSATG